MVIFHKLRTYKVLYGVQTAAVIIQMHRQTRDGSSKPLPSFGLCRCGLRSYFSWTAPELVWRWTETLSAHLCAEIGNSYCRLIASYLTFLIHKYCVHEAHAITEDLKLFVRVVITNILQCISHFLFSPWNKTIWSVASPVLRCFWCVSWWVRMPDSFMQWRCSKRHL